MSDAILNDLVELPALLATFRQEIVVDHAGWAATVDQLLRDWPRPRIQAAIDEIDALLAAGLSEHELGKALWSLGAQAFPDKTPVATLHDLRGHLAGAA